MPVAGALGLSRGLAEARFAVVAEAIPVEFRCRLDRSWIESSALFQLRQAPDLPLDEAAPPL